MLDYWLFGAITFIVLGTSFLLHPKYQQPPAYIGDREDVPTLVRTAAMKKKAMWEVFDRLAKKYGDIFSFELGGKPVVVLNSAQMATDLLDKRGDIYSSRPRLIMAHEILAGNLRGLSAPYGEYWRKWRKIQHTGMSGRASLAYREHQALESTVLLRDLALDSSNYSSLVERFAVSVVMSISYGKRASSLEEEVVKVNTEVISELQHIIGFGKHIVDDWPSLLWLPRPLQWFRHDADKKFAADTSFYLQLLRDVRKRMDAGTAKECMSSRSLEAPGGNVSEVELAYSVAAPFGAGVDTTSGSIEYAILAMILYPETARRAQVELDAIVGRGRFPSFEDESALPYLRSFILELSRWRPPVPLAVPHAVTRDDFFLGGRIAKGTTVYGNIYTMMQDPVMFPEPEEFRLERFLNDKVASDFTLPFGFGRRQCPGMHVASQSLFIVIARLLWAFDVMSLSTPDPHSYVNHGLVRGPGKISFELRFRDKDARRLVEAEAAEAEERLKEWA